MSPSRSRYLSMILITCSNTPDVVNCKGFVVIQASSRRSVYVNFSGANIRNCDLAISLSIASNFRKRKRDHKWVIIMYTNLIYTILHNLRHHQLLSMYTRYLPLPPLSHAPHSGILPPFISIGFQFHFFRVDGSFGYLTCFWIKLRLFNT